MEGREWPDASPVRSFSEGGGNYTVYVNPYIVLKSGGYTKHYYIEGQRIVSKLGGGCCARRSRDRFGFNEISIRCRACIQSVARAKAGDNNGKGTLKAGGSEVDYVGRSQKVFDGIVKNLKFLGADGQILTAGKSGKVPPGQISLLPCWQ